MEDMMGELISSQQSMRNELQSNNEVVQVIQNAQKEHKANMDMMNKQLSQLENSMSEMKGNSGALPSTLHISGKANVSQITLRSGTAYKGPKMKSPSRGSGPELFKELVSNKLCLEWRTLSSWMRKGWSKVDMELKEEQRKYPERDGKDGTPILESSNRNKAGSTIEPSIGARRKPTEEVTEILRNTTRGEKPFPYRFVTRRKKENPVDYASIFGRLDDTIPFLQVVKLPPFGKLIQGFHSRKSSGGWKDRGGRNSISYHPGEAPA